MRVVSAPRRRPPRSSWTSQSLSLAVAAAAAIGVALVLGVWAAGCAGGTSQTSVYLQIYDSTPVSAATDVDIDVYDPGSGAKIASLSRTAPPSTSGADLLGTLVIYPDDKPGLDKLHIQSQRLEQGVLVSQGSADVTLDRDHQIGVSLTMGMSAGGPDAGGAADAGSPPVVDAGTDTRPALLANGGACKATADCASGNCVSGICCDQPCNAACQSCNLPGSSKGTCLPSPAGTTCAAASCNAATNTEVSARTCDGNGVCNAAPAAHSCGAYRCYGTACLTSCFNSFNCTAPATCSVGKCK